MSLWIFLVFWCTNVTILQCIMTGSHSIIRKYAKLYPSLYFTKADYFTYLCISQNLNKRYIQHLYLLTHIYCDSQSVSDDLDLYKLSSVCAVMAALCVSPYWTRTCIQNGSGGHELLNSTQQWVHLVTMKNKKPVLIFNAKKCSVPENVKKGSIQSCKC